MSIEQIGDVFDAWINSVESIPQGESFSFLHSLQGALEGKQYLLTQQG
jgi:hypothetical protein